MRLKINAGSAKNYRVLGREEKLLVSLFYTLPLGGLIWDLGVNVEIWKVTALALLVLIGVRRDLPVGAVPLLATAYLLYTVMITLIMGPLTPDHPNANPEMFRNAGTRWIVQLVAFFLEAMVFYSAARLVAGGITARALMASLINAVLVLCAIGYVMYVLDLLGLYEMKILAVNVGQGRDATMAVGGFLIKRLSSLAAEPKSFGNAILPALIATMTLTALGVKDAGTFIKGPRASTLFLLPAFVLTFSTSAFFALALSIPGLLLAVRMSAAFRLRMLGTIIAFGLLVLVGASVNPEAATALYTSRIDDRLGEVDHPEQATLAFLMDRPFFLILGTGVGSSGFYAIDYLKIDETVTYLMNNALPLASRILRIVAESGLIGLTLFLSAVISIIGRLRRTMVANAREPFLVACLASGVAVLASLPFCASSYSVLILGCLTGLAKSPEFVSMARPKSWQLEPVRQW